MRKKFLLMLTVLVIALGGSGKLFAADENVAKVGNTEYATIGEAIAAWTNGTTLTLLADVTLSDVIQLSSTEMHTLDLSSFTMTAASKKDAIQIVNNGRSSASYALDIKADATNPGGITATGKTVVVTTGKSGVKDRPIIRFYNGVFNGSNIVKHSGSNGTNCPQFQFHGGVFNGKISTNRALNQFYGGVFNGSLMMSVDSSAYTLIAGGTFKQLSNLYGSALNSGKFTIGSAKGVYDKEVYIDESGNYVIAAAKPAEGIEAAVAKTPGSNDYLAYSKVATEGQLNYTNVETALKNNTSATVTVYAEDVDLSGINFKGTIVLPENHTVVITNAPANLKVQTADGKTLTPNTNGEYTSVPPVAKIGNTEYATLIAAVAAVQDDETITLIANEIFTATNYSDNGGWRDGVAYSGDKSFTIDLNGHTIGQDGYLNDYLFWFKNVGLKENTITIKNGTLDAGTTAFCALCTASSHENQLTINTENIKLINNISNGSTVKVRAGSVLNVNEGTEITGKNSYLGIETWNATVNIYDGAKIYMNGTASYNGCLVGVGGNGTVNVYGGYGKGVKGGFIAMTSGGTINVKGGEWIANTDGTVGNNSNLYVLTAQSNKYESGFAGPSIINVTGGTLRGGMDAWVLNNLEGEKAELNISGGNFNSNPTNYVAEDYIAVENNGVWNVVKAAAKVGETSYATLEEAFKVATSGCTIDILSDVTVDYNWDARYTGGKFSVPVTINGNGKTIKFTASVNDNNYQAPFRFEADATVKNLTIDMSAATDNRFRAISSKGNLTVDGCKFIGKDESLNCRAIIFGEGAGANVGNLAISVTNSKFINWKRGITDNENGQDVKTATITGNTLENAAVYVSAYENVTFTGNIVEGAYVDIRSYTANSSLNVTATGNTLEENTDTAYNYIKATGNIDQEGFKVYAVAKIGDVEYTTIEKAYAALQEGDEIVILKKGSYALKVKNNITITGAVAGVEFANIGAFGCNGANVTFNNVTFTYAENSTYKGLQHSGNLVYNNCTFNGQVFLYGQSETFNKCTFNTTDSNNYNVWTYGAKEVAFNECTFNCAGKSVLIYNESASVTNNVTVVKSQFIATQAVEGKAAIEMDSSLSGAISLTIDGETTATGFGTGNVSGNSLWNNKKGNNDVANNDITVKVGDTVVLAPIFEAQIGDAQYRFFQDAINAVQNGETITVLRDIATNVEIKEKDNVKVTIDGNGMKMTGTIKVVALSSDNDRRITIKNFKFEDTTSASVDFITSVETNHYPRITVEDCTFTGSGDATDVALRLKSSKNVEIKNCTGTGLHSFLQNTSGWNLTIENVTVTDSKSGLALGTVQGVTVTGCNITADGYGIRMDAQYNNNAVIKSNTVSAFIPVVVRKAEVESNMTFQGTNTFTASNTDGLWCAIGTSEYETNGTMPTPATGRVSVTLNDAGLDVEGIYGYTISGEGTAEKPYLINNINDLIVFRNNVNAGNNYSGKYVKLNADIDLNNEAWEPIGYMGKNFIGNFDGGNHTISNLKVVKELTNAAANNGVGLFGRVDSPATIKNLTIENATVKGSLYVGAVVGYAYTGNAIENVTVKGNIAIDAYWYAGVIGGNGYMNLVNNCHVIGNDGSYIKGNNGSYIGGIWGFRGEGANNITNCTVTNLSIEGVDRVGGISGMAHYGNTISGCAVKDVTVAATDAEATTVGLIAGACQGTVSEPSTITYSEVDDVTVTIGGNNVDASIYGTKIDGTTPYTNYVARIGGMQYITLADAVAAAKDGETIEFLPLATNKVVAMNASLYGKSVTITGTAKVDWSKGFLFVGRGGEGDATLTFDNANLTSASNSASYGIHVSGREKNTTNKYDGTVVIKNSTIDLDYLINKGAMTLDKATLTVKNGFAIGGRPASETESGADATATITLNNGSKVVVNNHNGMGLGYEAIGVMNISSGSTFECTQDFLVTAKGTMNVNGGVVTTDVKITNNGVINVSGESTLNIASFEGEEIKFLDGATIKNSTIGGNVFVAGNVTFRGANTFAMLYDYGTLTDYYGTTAPMKWTVEEGASVTLTTAARYGLGYGDDVTVYGNIENALTTRETLTDADRSLFMHGLVAQESKGWNCDSKFTVKNAYVAIGSNNSFGNKSGNYGGAYTFNINNSVVDASRITFYEALSTTTFTIDGSDVKMGTFMTRDTDSKFVLKNSKVLSTTTSNGTDEGNYNKGELTLVNSSLTYSAEFKHEAGVINLDLNSLLTAPKLSGAGTINVDAADFVIGGEDVQVVTANMSGFTGTINVANNNYVIAEITETGVVIKEKELEGEGTADNPYELETLTELELFRNKVNAGDNYAGKYVKLSADVNLAATRSANNWEPIGTTANPFKGTFDGDGYIISNLVVEGENYVGLFGYADNATIKNVTIKNANVKGVECVGVIAGNVYSTSLIDNCHVKGNIKVEGQTSVGGIVGKYYTKVSNCSVIGDGVATSYVKGTYVESDFEGDNIGGIMGHGGENNRFTGNTVKNITISGTRKVGGVVGVTDKATQVVNCVVENVNIETTATAEYAASNKAKSGHGAIVGSYTTGGTAGLVADCVVKDVNFINEDSVIVSAGPITGGARGGSDSMLAPEGVTSSNNDIYMSTITGSNNEYLMNAVAKIGDVKYYALQDAFNAGGEVTVISDINLTEGVTVAAGKVVTLDLNGKDVSYTSSVAGEDMITNRGDLTIVNGSTAKTGKITYNNTDATANNVTVSTISTEPGSTLVVNGGTIENKTVKADGSSIYSYAIDILTNGNLGDVNVTINGDTVYSDYMAIRQFNNGTACKNSLTIKGGYIYGAKRAVQVHMDNNAAYTTIVNGKVEAGANGYSLCFFPTTSENISVSGGEFIGNVYSGSNGFITGGTFTVDPQAFCAAGYTAKVNYDGTYTVKQTAGTLTRTLPEGWSWFSSYVDLYEGVEGDGLAVLENALGENGVQIKDNAGQAYVNYSNGRWRGSLATVSSETMYAIKTSAEHTLEITGEFYDINEYEVSLRNGWNYLSYPHYEAMPVVNALGFTPANGDAIKGKGVTAFYLNNSWLGAFSLTPGEGYMYYSNEAGKEFSYSTEETRSSVKSYVSESSEYWTVDASQYPSNMTMIATLDVEGADYEVAAFVDGEVRGSARPIYVDFLDQYIVVMTINGENVANVTFKYYDFNAGEEYDLNNVAVYSNNAILGSVNNPYALTRGTTGIGEATLSDINIYPNPTTTDREINLQATCDKVEVFNTLGVKVAEYQNVDTIDALETAGTYVIRVTLNGDVKHCRLVVK